MGYGTIATIEGTHDRERLVVNLCHEDDGSSRLELCRESWSDSVGWFVQSRVRLHPSELAGLRTVLGPVSGALGRTGRGSATTESAGPNTLKFPASASA
jgi:hypothetical protein